MKRFTDSFYIQDTEGNAVKADLSKTSSGSGSPQAILSGSDEYSHSLHVPGLREHIEGLELYDPVAFLFKSLQITD